MVSGESPLNDTVTGDPALGSLMANHIKADPDTGTLVVANILSGVPDPLSDATINENGKSPTLTHVPELVDPTFW
jgi:hypothetical protein